MPPRPGKVEGEVEGQVEGEVEGDVEGQKCRPESAVNLKRPKTNPVPQEGSQKNRSCSVAIFGSSVPRWTAWETSIGAMSNWKQRKDRKDQGMVDVQHGKRRKCSCGKSPCFGLPSGRATHCKECKEQGMVDVVSRRCSCGKCVPCFGMPETCLVPIALTLPREPCNNQADDPGMLRGSPAASGGKKYRTHQD